ncbi:hypothetical protein AAIA72_13250 [Hahella sp. SMD15-11]|uniref:Multidrug transporter n=1 Tax=Thermohahella caldifontis TaxID=3142973 RepID=A0AB39UV11_9GAMM
MIKRSLRRILPLMAALVLVLPTTGYSEVLEEKPSALAMLGDAVFARPVLLATTVAGAAVYVVSLPFSLAGGNAKEAADTLVTGPAKATFVRCLGCTKVGRKKEVIFTGE